MSDHQPAPPLSRSEAKARGLKVYKSWRYCRFGHDAMRTVSQGRCVQCMEAARTQRDRIRAKATATLKAQLKAQVLREQARDQARQAKAEAEARQQARALAATEKQKAREAAELAALEALPEADRAVALAAREKAARASLKAYREAALLEKHTAAQADSRARFYANAAHLSRPGVERAALPHPPELDDDSPPWD